MNKNTPPPMAANINRMIAIHTIIGMPPSFLVEAFSALSPAGSVVSVVLFSIGSDVSEEGSVTAEVSEGSVVTSVTVISVSEEDGAVSFDSDVPSGVTGTAGVMESIGLGVGDGLGVGVGVFTDASSLKI